VAGGQQKLNDIINNARRGRTLKLWTAFDPNSYASDADKVTMTFIGSLANSDQGQGWDGEPVDTTGLADLWCGSRCTEFGLRPECSGWPSSDPNADDPNKVKKQPASESIF